MKLQQYMETHGLTDEELATKVGRDRSVVSRYRRGEVMPPSDVIREIQNITKMAVQFEDWFEGAA